MNPFKEAMDPPGWFIWACKAGSGSYDHLVTRQGELVGPTDSKLNPTSSMS